MGEENDNSPATQLEHALKNAVPSTAQCEGFISSMPVCFRLLCFLRKAVTPATKAWFKGESLEEASGSASRDAAEALETAWAQEGITRAPRGAARVLRLGDGLGAKVP